ncbi:MAG TPA: cadherin-like beta sandwich domain-containing protein, partial [Nitrospira sp.]
TTPVNIVVSESGTNSRTYTVLLKRAALAGNNSLQNLTISPGPLDPGFTTNTLSYRVDVAGNTSSVIVSPTTEDPAATMTLNGQTTTSGEAQTITLRDPGLSTVVNIVVTAQNGSPKPYVVTVNRAALSGDNNLSALTVTSGTLAPAFASGQQNYTVDVATDVASVSVSATKSDPNAVISGDVPNEGQANIPLGGPGTTKDVLITVTAQNGNSKTYRITMKRAAPTNNNNLSGLSVSAGSLSPPFTPEIVNYSAVVPAAVDRLTVSATKSDPNAVMSALGSVIAAAGVSTGQVTITPGLGANTSVAITVIAPDGSQKTYAIHVFRLPR